MPRKAVFIGYLTYFLIMIFCDLIFSEYLYKTPFSRFSQCFQDSDFYSLSLADISYMQLYILSGIYIEHFKDF